MPQNIEEAVEHLNNDNFYEVDVGFIKNNTDAKYFINVFEDETDIKTCPTCGGSGVLSDEHYAKFSEEDKRQAEARWLKVQQPKRKHRTLHISEVMQDIMSELRRGCY